MVATLVRQSLSGNSASYLADECRLVVDARERRLCSTEIRTCVITQILISAPLVTELLQIVGPRHSANYFNCTI